ncbi:hypothetical protein ACFQ1S_42495, partial [Kibdelosporangium lantanae]
MLRIHFTTVDLVRTRVAAAADPFWEMVFSQRRLSEPDTPLVLNGWREQMRVGASVGVGLDDPDRL